MCVSEPVGVPSMLRLIQCQMHRVVTPVQCGLGEVGCSDLVGSEKEA